MKITSSQLDDSTIRIDLAGRMDIEGTNSIDLEFTAAAASAQRERVIVDLSQVDFLASIGIRSILTVARAVQRRGGKLVLLSPAPLVRKVLETSGVDTLVPVLNDIQGARAL